MFDLLKGLKVVDLTTVVLGPAAEMFHEVDDTRVGSLNVIRSPFEVDGELFHDRYPNAVAPGLGGH